MKEDSILNATNSSLQNGDPKVKTNKTDEAILNKQDDNSYEEPVTDNTPKKQDPGKEAEKKENFDYADNGEFEEGAQITNTDSEEEFL